VAQYDVIFVGAGPGGYVGAIRAAQLGLKTAVVEKEKTLGGTCLNVGCIPSKALLDSSEHFSEAKHGKLLEHGVKTTGVELDLETMMGRKSKIVKDLTGGIAFLFKKNKIDTLAGTGKLLGGGKVEVNGEVHEAKNIVLASGSIPVSLPSVVFDGQRILSSTEALSLKEVPTHLIVIGAGFIGLEMGSVWGRLGAKITVVEFADKICGAMDKGLSASLQRALEKQGFTFILNTKVTGARVSAKGVSVSIEGKAGEKMESLEGDYALVSVGRRAYSEGLGLEAAGIAQDKAGRVVIDDHFRTNVPGIFAIGDLVRGPMLAHKAEEEGVAVAEIIAGRAGHVNYDTVPGVIYTWPEAASVGLSEEQLKEKGVDYKVGQFSFAANARAKALGYTEGYVKFLSDKKTDRVLGCHIIGPRASDLIAEAVIAMEFSASTEDIARSFHAHPTLSEVMREAALAVDKLQRQS
jgi:dihydrolipoamide dehydrogenase